MPKNKYIPQFKIGDIVEVNFLIRKCDVTNNNRNWCPHGTPYQPKPKPVVAVVVGYYKIKKGELICLVDDALIDFNPKKTINVVLLRTALFGPERMAFPGDVQLLKGIPPKIPLLDRRQPLWSERDKSQLREIMREWPRDAKGRWIKG